MVWDRGNYHVYGEEPLKALREADCIWSSTAKRRKGNGL